MADKKQFKSGITASAIAKACGVSQTTVSFVLNGKGDLLKPETMEKVLKTAKEMGYRPNAMARGMAMGRMNAIGLVSPTTELDYFNPNELVRGLISRLHEVNMKLIMDEVSEDMLASDKESIQIPRELGVDGLLINYPNVQHPEIIWEALSQYRIPFAWINTKQPSDCIYPDELSAGKQVTEKLISLGHKRICYLHFGSKSHFSTIDREGGYLAAMEAAGLTPQIIDQPWRAFLREKATPREDHRIEAVLTALQEKNRPTAILAYGSSAMYITVRAAAALGLDIPNDLSLATFSDWAEESTGLSIYTMVTPFLQIAHTAVDMLLKKIDTPDKPLVSQQIPYYMITGDTISSPKN